MNHDQYSELFSLLGELREKTITEERFELLEKLLKDDLQAQHYYVDYMMMCADLKNILPSHMSGVPIYSGVTETPDQLEPTPEEVLKEVIDEDNKIRAERSAEEARRRAEARKEAVKQTADEAFRKFREEERRRQEKLAYKRYKARQRGLIMGICGLAACLLLVVLTWIFSPQVQSPVTITSPPVATIAQMRNAQWQDPEFTPGEGTRLAAIDMELKRGIVQITFDDGAEVILSAPCRFRPENANQMFLESGNLTAVVPKKAIGFTVRTFGATIVDYGTEFGVSTRADGLTEAHVFKGAIDLRTGSDTRVYQQSQRLKSGEANAVDIGGNISPVKYKANVNRFIRKMPKEEILSLPGQRLDLSDIIAGGNGFGSAPEGYAINPDTGAQVKGITTAYNAETGNAAYFIANCQYNLVHATPFIDGVFVPDGSAGPVKVSSGGHLFYNCPDTTGRYYVAAFSTATMTNLPQTGFPREFIVGGEKYNTLEKPAICMHANLGVTFDLDKIRSALPGCGIVKFQALLGMAEDVQGIWLDSQASFWVLVDGKARFSRIKITAADSGAYIDVELNSRDRFLTLIATEGEDKRNNYDWCVLAEPTLELTVDSAKR